MTLETGPAKSLLEISVSPIPGTLSFINMSFGCHQWLTASVASGRPSSHSLSNCLKCESVFMYMPPAMNWSACVSSAKNLMKYQMFGQDMPRIQPLTPMTKCSLFVHAESRVSYMAVETIGEAFSRLASRLRCPRCGSRNLVVLFQPPTNGAVANLV